MNDKHTKLERIKEMQLAIMIANMMSEKESVVDDEFRLLAAGAKFDCVELKTDVVLCDKEFAAKYFDVDAIKTTLGDVYRKYIGVANGIIAKYDIPKVDGYEIIEQMYMLSTVDSVKSLLYFDACRAMFTVTDQSIRKYVSDDCDECSDTTLPDDFMTEVRNIYDSMYAIFQDTIKDIPEEYYENIQE